MLPTGPDPAVLAHLLAVPAAFMAMSGRAGALLAVHAGIAVVLSVRIASPDPDPLVVVPLFLGIVGLAVVVPLAGPAAWVRRRSEGGGSR